MKTRTHPASLAIADGTFTFTKEGVGGWRNISFALNGANSAGRLTEVDSLEEGCLARIEMDGWREQLHFRADSDHDALIVTRTVVNTGTEPLSLRQVADGRLSDEAAVHFKGLHEYTCRFLHTRNVRTEMFPFSRPEGPYLKPIPYVPIHLGLGEGNDLPALCITDDRGSVGLIEGDLNQIEFLRSWELGLTGGPAKRQLIGTYHGLQHRPLAAAPMQLEPGESVQVSKVFYQILEAPDFNDVYTDYLEALTKEHAFRGPHTPLRHKGVFCTWNYGTLHNISETLLAERARAVAERVPDCRYFLIDDGYQQDRGQRNGPIDCFYPAPAQRYDREKFPSGMRAMAATIRSHGLTPAIWLSPSVYFGSPLAEEHPDWLLCDAGGDPRLLGDQSTFLDLSVEPARAFFLDVLDALLVDWGFQGVKFDFMTQWFSLERGRFRNGGSGLYWRNWVYSEIRKRIGEEGLFMTCIAMSLGNPFPGLYADCYRCGCDIHDGTWEEQLRSVKATFPQILLEGRTTFLLNMDSAGFGEAPMNEQLVRQTWIFITQGIIELGGPVESMPESQIQLWAKLLDHADRGHKVHCLDDHAFTNDAPPRILMVDYPEGCTLYRKGVRKHIALFNWTDEPQIIGRAASAFGLESPATLRNYWTDETVLFDNAFFSELLPPRSARLYELTAD